VTVERHGKKFEVAKRTRITTFAAGFCFSAAGTISLCELSVRV